MKHIFLYSRTAWGQMGDGILIYRICLSFQVFNRSFFPQLSTIMMIMTIPLFRIQFLFHQKVPWMYKYNVTIILWNINYIFSFYMACKGRRIIYFFLMAQLSQNLWLWLIFIYTPVSATTLNKRKLKVFLFTYVIFIYIYTHIYIYIYIYMSICICKYI